MGQAIAFEYTRRKRWPSIAHRAEHVYIIYSGCRQPIAIPYTYRGVCRRSSTTASRLRLPALLSALVRTEHVYSWCLSSRYCSASFEDSLLRALMYSWCPPRPVARVGSAPSHPLHFDMHRNLTLAKYSRWSLFNVACSCTLGHTQCGVLVHPRPH